GWVNVDAAVNKTLVVSGIVPEINGRPAFNKNMYRCKMTMSDGDYAYTAPATLSVETMRVSKDIDYNYDKYVGNACKLAFEAEKILQTTGEITYQWYVNRNDGEGFVEEAGATAPAFNAYTKAECDGWMYSCVATNGLDRKESNVATVNVMASPKLVSQSRKVAIFEGGETELKVVVEGGYSISYQWARFDPDTKQWYYIDGATDPSYFVEGVPENDGASFRCEVYETIPGGAPVKKFTTSAIKTPLEAPAEFAEPALEISQLTDTSTYIYDGSEIDRDAYADYPINFKANASGYALKYQWSSSEDGENFADIKGATKNVYSIKAPVANPDGEPQYLKCTVYNLNDSDIATSQSIVIALNVKQCAAPASLATQALNFEGASSFDFIPTGTSKCILSFDETTSAAGSYSYKRVSPTTATFKLASATVNISGDLVFDDDGNGAVGGYAVQKLSEEEGTLPETLQLSLNQDLVENLKLYNKTKANLEVDASTLEGVAITYAWFVDKQDDKGFVSAGGKTNVLSITPNESMIGWQYYCVISNGFEQIYSSTAVISELTDKAVITTKPKAVTVFDSEESIGVFEIAVSGGYAPSFQWQVSYDGKTWTNIEGATNSMLTIKGSDYQGTKPKFRCEVFDEGIKVLTSGAVAATVKKAARFALDPFAVTQKIGKTADILDVEDGICVGIEYYPITMTANATGDALKYQWYVDGEPISGATKSSYTIKAPEFGMRAYTCEAYNLNGKEIGSIASEEFLLVTELLATPQDLTGLVYEIKNGSTPRALLGATSKSACKVLA
ncbi:MAG: hypothetical protein IKO42_07505, partial [Opitutales bacterium]|nr:hypothetical protein [Opitutales bacterium]